MGQIDRFEDLIAWQKARLLVKHVYEISCGADFRKDFGLCDQIRRASVSIMSNIAEGFERRRPADFFHFLLIAKASCAEVRSQIYVAFDAGYLNRKQFNDLLNRTEEVGKIIGGLYRSINPDPKKFLPKT